MVRIMLQAAANGGHVIRPWLGAAGQQVTAEIAASLGLARPEGVLLKEVAPGSPAARAGLRVGDVVLAVDGHEIDDAEGLRFRVATSSMSVPVRLVLWRAGERRDVTAMVTALPEQPPRQPTQLHGRYPLAGAKVANLNPAYADELGLDTATHGVVVVALDEGSIAARLGIEPGDIVASLNHRPVESVSQLKELLASLPGPWVVTVRRGDRLLSTPPLRG
jgi:S1-C subfamily serine protease